MLEKTFDNENFIRIEKTRKECIMNKSSIKNIFFNEIGDNNPAAKQINLAYSLYRYEFFEDKSDIEQVKRFVETTSHKLEELYRTQGDDGSCEGENILLSTCIFIAIMCIASRNYDDLDPVFARDLVHEALDAGHYLMVGQFKKEGEQGDDANERVLISDMSKNDSKLSRMEILSGIWAYSELLKTDAEIRNAYDHSMMAGMPQKMSRQKRYQIRLHDLLKLYLQMEKESDTKAFCAMEFLACFSALLLNEDSEEGEDENQSDLIKVIEINVIGKKKKFLTKEEASALEEGIQHCADLLA